MGSLVFVYYTDQFNDMSQINYYTEEGLKKLKDELHDMKTVQRPAISDQIAEARDKGDLSENAEYDAAKEAQGLLEAKIKQLEGIIATARIVDENSIDTSKVSILTRVTVTNMGTKKQVTYQIVSEKEADLKAGKISVTSAPTPRAISPNRALKVPKLSTSTLRPG